MTAIEALFFLARFFDKIGAAARGKLRNSVLVLTAAIFLVIAGLGLYAIPRIRALHDKRPHRRPVRKKLLSAVR